MLSILKRFLLLWLFVLSALAIAWPNLWDAAVASEGTSSALRKFDPFVASKGALNGIIGTTMFCIGCMLPHDEVREMGRRWTAVLSGTCVQYLSMPFLAWSLGTLLRLPHELHVGLMMAGCVPGAMASNVLTLISRGNVSYSVGLTTSATLVSPIVVPVAMWATLGASVDPDVFLSSAVNLLLFVVIPVVVGFVMAQQVPWIRNYGTWAEVIANLAILWIIAVVVGLNRDRLSAVTTQVAIALLLLNLLGYLAGWWGGKLLRLPDTMRRALTLEVGMQNAGLGAALATSLFPNLPAAALAPALYAFGCMFTGTMLAQWMGRTHTADAPLKEQPPAEAASPLE